MLEFGVQIEAVLIKMAMDEADAEAITIFRGALSDAPTKLDTSDTSQLEDATSGGGGGAVQPTPHKRRSTVNLRRIHWQGLNDGNVSKSVFSRSNSNNIDDASSPLASPEQEKLQIAPEPVTQREVTLLENLFLEKEAKKIEKKKKKEGPKLIKLLGVRRQNGVS
jgi:hypothetical protein